MAEIVGFIGVIGGGKNYQKDLLLARGYKGLDFKDELIAMTEDLVGFSIRDDYDRFKLNLVGLTKPKHIILDHPHEITANFLETYPLAMTGRRLLQRLGTEAIRKRDADYWVNAWKKKAQEYLAQGHSVAAADVRFANEIAAITSLSKEINVPARIVFCDYRSPRYNAESEHESEWLAQAFLEIGMKDLQPITTAETREALAVVAKREQTLKRKTEELLK